MALKSMSANKLRTSLTMLGIVIGVASVIIVYSAGEGIRSLLVGQIESFGTNIVETEVKVPTNKKGTEGSQESAMSVASGIQITTLNLDDLEDINKMSNVSGGYAGILSQDQASYANEQRKVYLLGTNASYIDIDQSEIAAGRFFTDAEDRSLAPVIVLGANIKEQLFGDSEAIGKFITLHSAKYQIIGTMEKRGEMGMMNFDDYVYVPIRTLQKKISGIDYVFYLVNQLRDPDKAEETAAEMRDILRENHEITNPDKDDFQVTTMSEMMKTLDTATGALTILLLAIIAISLIVGGVGILNVMYVIVSERTAEIGLRKAVGANYQAIVRQFLVESIVITFSGGLIGIIAGVLLSLVLAFVASSFGLDWKFSVPVKAFVVAISFSLLFGVAFGIGPAKKAARLDPVEAMRKE